MRTPAAPAAALVAVGVVVFVLAMLFVAAPLQPCSPGVGASIDWCGPSRPAWLASLPPIDRFLVDNRDVLPLIWVGLAVLAGVAAELIWRLVASRQRKTRVSRRD